MSKKVIAYIFLWIVWGTVVLSFGHKARETAQIREMDRRELQYDADDWFILIDRSTGLCGIYRACTPMEHKYLEDVPAAGLYKAEEIEIAWEVPEWTPVLIYEQEDKRCTK